MKPLGLRNVSSAFLLLPHLQSWAQQVFLPLPQKEGFLFLNNPFPQLQWVFISALKTTAFIDLSSRDDNFCSIADMGEGPGRAAHSCACLPFLPSGLCHIRHVLRVPISLFCEHPVEFWEKEPAISMAPWGFTLSHQSTHSYVHQLINSTGHNLPPSFGCICPRWVSACCLFSPWRYLSLRRFWTSCGTGKDSQSRPQKRILGSRTRKNLGWVCNRQWKQVY